MLFSNRILKRENSLDALILTIQYLEAAIKIQNYVRNGKKNEWMYNDFVII